MFGYNAIGKELDRNYGGMWIFKRSLRVNIHIYSNYLWLVVQ